MSLVFRLLDFITPTVSPRKGEFEYIPADHTNFLVLVKHAESIWRTLNEAKDPVFVDAGCGIGDKVFLAYEALCVSCVGLDIQKKYIDVAKRLAKGSGRDRYMSPSSLGDRVQFRVQNILTQDYSEFDIIYFYCPLRDPAKERLFEQRVIDTAKPGSVIVPYSSLGRVVIDKLRRIEYGHNDFWVKRD